jgi:hypothetical protein
MLTRKSLVRQHAFSRLRHTHTYNRTESRSSFRDIPSTSLDGWHKRGYIYNPISDTQNITLCSRGDEYSVANEPIREKNVCLPYHRERRRRSFFFFLTPCIQDIIHKNDYNIHLHHNPTTKALVSTTTCLFLIHTYTHTHTHIHILRMYYMACKQVKSIIFVFFFRRRPKEWWMTCNNFKGLTLIKWVVSSFFKLRVDWAFLHGEWIV